MKPIRQGDVWLYPIDEELKDSAWIPLPKEVGTDDVLLALGEVTGHAHRIAASSRVQFRRSRYDNIGGGRRTLRVMGSAPVLLTHEEHETLEVPPGNYEVRIQREYHPEKGQRMVLD